MRTSCIVLAAGMSKRVGTPKQLLEVRGKPMLQHVVDLVRELGMTTVVVVLGSAAKSILGKVDFVGCQTVINECFSEGLASSLIVGFNTIRDAADSVVIFLGDQPFVEAETVRQLLLVHGKTRLPLTVPVFKGTKGTPFIADASFLKPVLDDRELLSGFRMFEGDQGAKLFFDRYENLTLNVGVEDSGVINDIDYLTDLARLAE